MVSFFKEYLFNFSGPGHLYYDENLTNEGKKRKIIFGECFYW